MDLRRASFYGVILSWPLLLALVWLRAPDWSYQPDVAAPLTRQLLFFHPASAWTSFAAYFVVFVASIFVLNERRHDFDRPARAAAEVGFLMNTIALVTGTLWGLPEWQVPGQNGLVTVFTEPKVLVVLVLWLTFAAYLTLRRLIDDPERRARLAAVFGVLGFLGVPMSFATSRVLKTSLHPDIAGPGRNPDAAVGGEVGLLLAWSALAFLLLFLHLFLQRLQILRIAHRLEVDHAD